MSSATSDKAHRWFEVCDERGKGKITAALGHAAKVRVRTAGGGDAPQPPPPKNGTAEVTADAFVKDMLALVQKVEKESDANKELDAMIAEVETYGPPPVETGDPVKDMHAYRSYHGMDKALGWLLQKLVTEQPADPVKDLLERVEKLDSFAALRKRIGDQPYEGKI